MVYLTTAEYIARFGERETIRLTNEVPGGTTFESDKVDNAIQDAMELVDGYIGPRYATPVASAPRILKGWTAALAREKLYIATGTIPDAVKNDADLARKALYDVQKGNMTLPIPEGTDPLVTTGNGSPVSSLDREAPVFAGTGALDGYLPPIGGSCLPNWRRGC